MTRAELQQLERLQRRKDRRESGLCLVEGPLLLREALAAGLVPELVAAEEDLQGAALDVVARAAAAGARIVTVEARAAARVSDREHARGLLAAVPQPERFDIEDAHAVPADGPVLVLLLAGLQDPGNVGTLLRSARAFGAAGCLCTEGTADPFGPKVVRASAGAALHLPTTSATLEQGTDLARRFELTVAVAVPPREGAGGPGSDVPSRCLLVLGHETRGAPDVNGTPVSVAHEPAVESLNVAMAGSVLMAGWYGRRPA